MNLRWTVISLNQQCQSWSTSRPLSAADTALPSYTINMSADFDIVIVGGGLFGLTTAETLAKGAYKGRAERILVIDRYDECPAPDAAR